MSYAEQWAARQIDELMKNLWGSAVRPGFMAALEVISSDLLPRPRIIDPLKVRSPARALRRWRAGKRKVDPFSLGPPPAYRFSNTLVVSPEAFRELAKQGWAPTPPSFFR